MKKRNKEIILKILSLATATLPVAAAIVSYFPIWRSRGAVYVLSGLVLLLLILAYAPILKFIKKQLESPAVWGIWLAVFILFFALSKIADEMCVIGFIGFISNLAASVLWRLGERGRTEGGSK